MTRTAADQTYNGWTNYETWLTGLWLSNDQATDRVAREIVTAAPDRVAAADALRDWIADANPLLGEASLYSDLLNAALGAVDWYELAEYLLAD